MEDLSNQQYRQWFRQNRLAKGYHPYLHMLFNFCVLGLLILAHFYLVKNWSYAALGFLLLTAIVGNITVYFLHRFPLHQRYKLWSYPYTAHTIEHHRYFTSDYITYDDKVDLGAVFFPCRVVAGFALIAQPLFYFSFNYFVGSDLAHVFAGATAGYFLLYELFHWSSHLKAEHPLLRLPWIRYMRAHHLAHHHPKLMNRYNFCIVYPLMDVVLRTKYRGELPIDFKSSTKNE